MLFAAHTPVRRSGRSRRTAPHAAGQTQESRNSGTSAPASSLPVALPCHNWFEVYPEDIGPMGNVELEDLEELRTLLLGARRVSGEEAERCGGCVKVTPSTGGEPQYYCITDSDDEVYGRASYLPLAPLPYSDVPCAAGWSSTLSSSSSSCACSDDHDADCGHTMQGTEMSASYRCV